MSGAHKGCGRWGGYLEASVYVRFLSDTLDLVKVMIIHMRVNPEKPLQDLHNGLSEILAEWCICQFTLVNDQANSSSQQHGRGTGLDGEGVLVVDEALNPGEELLHIFWCRQLHGLLLWVLRPQIFIPNIIGGGGGVRPGHEAVTRQRRGRAGSH